MHTLVQTRQDRVAIRKRMRIEHAAWLCLMASVVCVCCFLYHFRDQAADYLRSHSLPSMLVRAAELDASGQTAQANALFSRIIERYPENEEALLAYAAYLEARGFSTRAEAMYARAASTGRQSHSAVRRYAWFLTRDGREEQAIALYRHYLAEYPDDATAQLDLGIRLLWRGDAQASIPHLEAASQMPELCLEAETRLGEACNKLGRKAEALEAWTRAVALNRGEASDVLLQDIATLHEEAGDSSSAIDALKQYLKRFPGSVIAVDRLAKLYAATGMAQERQRMELRRRVLTPKVVLNAQAHLGVVLTGYSLSGEPVSGSTVVVELFMSLTRNIAVGDEPGVRFWLSREGSMEPELLLSEPSSVGPGPLWRGDMVRQAYAIVIPSGLSTSSWRMEVSVGDGSRILLYPQGVTPNNLSATGVS